MNKDEKRKPIPPGFYTSKTLEPYLTEEDKRQYEDFKRRADLWAKSLEGKRTRKKAEEAYAKSGDLGDFIAIMLGASRVSKK